MERPDEGDTEPLDVGVPEGLGFGFWRSGAPDLASWESGRWEMGKGIFTVLTYLQYLPIYPLTQVGSFGGKGDACMYVCVCMSASLRVGVRACGCACKNTSLQVCIFARLQAQTFAGSRRTYYTVLLHTRTKGTKGQAGRQEEKGEVSPKKKMGTSSSKVIQG